MDASTRERRSALTGRVWLITWETVVGETPARCATSRLVTTGRSYSQTIAQTIACSIAQGSSRCQPVWKSPELGIIPFVSAIQLTNVSKRYGKYAAVTDLTLAVP